MIGSVLLTALTFLHGQGALGSSESAGIRCDIQVIHATKGPAHVDPALRPIARYLESSFGNRYTRFVRLGRADLDLSKGQTGRQALPNGTHLELTYLGTESTLHRLELAVDGLKTRVKIHDGGLFFQAGRRYKDGMLIVAFRTSAR